MPPDSIHMQPISIHYTPLWLPHSNAESAKLSQLSSPTLHWSSNTTLVWTDWTHFLAVQATTIQQNTVDDVSGSSGLHCCRMDQHFTLPADRHTTPYQHIDTQTHNTVVGWTSTSPYQHIDTQTHNIVVGWTSTSPYQHIDTQTHNTVVWWTSTSPYQHT